MGGVVHPSVLTFSACPSSGIVSVLSSVVPMTIVGHLHMGFSSLSPLVQSYPRASRISSRIFPLRQSERGMASMVHAVSHSVQFNSVAQWCLTLCDPMDCSTPGLPVHHQLPEFSQFHVMSRDVTWCHPTISSSVIPFSSCLQSFPASGSFLMSQFFIAGGQSTGVSASASVLPRKSSGLISFRTDWLDLLAVQGTLKSLLQHILNIAGLLRSSSLDHPT